MTTDTPAVETAERRSLFTRRRVLLGVGGVFGVGVLGSGGFFLADHLKRFARSAHAVIPDHRVDVPDAVPRMVIAHGPDPGRNARAVVERLGGMARFVGPSDVVVIKPNIGWDRTAEQGANTHPFVVGELVRMCREARCRRVIVSDCPVRRSRTAFERSGILRVAGRDEGSSLLKGVVEGAQDGILITDGENVTILRCHPRGKGAVPHIRRDRRIPAENSNTGHARPGQT